eukprot:scaffold1112_cov354-Pavlova_lutheri.AAC.2
MAYVDGNGMFRAVPCGWAGSCADGGVIMEMHFTKMLQLPPMVLANSAFGLEAWQMIPFKIDNGAVFKIQRRFHWIHISARVVVEHAFGRLKGRSGLLLGTHKTSWQLGAHAIMAALWAEGVEELESSGEGAKGPMGSALTEQLEAAMVFKDGFTDLHATWTAGA